jgi:hypothetical protein
LREIIEVAFAVWRVELIVLVLLAKEMAATDTADCLAFAVGRHGEILVKFENGLPVSGSPDGLR